MTQSKTLGPYLFVKTLGEGTFAKVKLAIHQPTQQLVAIKILNKQRISDISDVQRINREIHILKLVRHSNIIQLYQIIQTPKHLFFVMEYCENGELFNYIVDKGKLKQQDACKLFEQLISGLEYLHKLHVSHRDLKAQNLLLDHENNIKIVDFGLANTYTQNETLKTPCGSQVYAAPQILQGDSYNGQMVDIWSSGVILFAMVCGYLPFQDQDPVQLNRKIINGKFILPSTISPQLKDLIDKILTKNPSKRVTIEKIRSHPWMNKHLQIHSHRNKGLVVGYNRIPVDANIVKKMGKQYSLDYVSKCLQANRHNNITTTYYLTLKKFIRQGGSSSCDLSSLNFSTNPLRSTSKSKQKIRNPISLIIEQQNKQNIPINGKKIIVDLNRKSISKKTSLKLNQSKLSGILHTKQSSTVATHKLIKPTKLNRLNESILSKASKKEKRQIDKSQYCSRQRISLNKKYISTKIQKKTKRSVSQQGNRSTIMNKSINGHQRQKSSCQIKKKLSQSFFQRPSLNIKRKK